MHLSKDLREFIESLNSSGVDLLARQPSGAWSTQPNHRQASARTLPGDYLEVVGAFAVAWHGWPRFTSDIDLFLRPSEENAAAAVSAIEAFGFRSLDILKEDLMSPTKWSKSVRSRIVST